MKSREVQLDVRDDIRAGREPFSRIMQASAQVTAGGKLVLIAPFEPKPLYEMLALQGFSHEERELEGGDWEIFFSRESQAGPEPKSEAGQ